MTSERGTESKSVFEIIKKNRQFLMLLSVGIFFIYFNSLNGGLVSDDIYELKDNPEAHTLSNALATLRIQKVVHGVSYALFGLNTIPLHVVSVVAHILVSILTFLLVAMLFNKPVAMAASILFASHPVNTEAVAWISGFNYMLNTLFFLITALFLIKHKQTESRGFLIASYISFALSILFMRFPWNVTTPVALTAVYLLFSRNNERPVKTIFKLLPYFALSLFLVLILKTSLQERVLYLNKNQMTGHAQKPPYYLNLPFTMYSQIKTLVIPKTLALVYPNQKLNNTRYLIMILVSAAMPIAFLLFLKHDRKISGLILMYMGFLAIALSPLQVSSTLADRYLYSASIPFVTLLSYVLYNAQQKYKIKHLLLVSVVLIGLLYSIRTIIRNFDWQSQKAQVLANVRISKGDPKTLVELADVFIGEKNYAEAADTYEQIVSSQPTNAEFRYNLGVVYYLMNRPSDAEAAFRQSLTLDPDLFEASYNLAVFEIGKGNINEAKALLEQALRAKPDYKPAIEALSLISQEQNGLPIPEKN